VECRVAFVMCTLITVSVDDVCKVSVRNFCSSPDAEMNDCSNLGTNTTGYSPRATSGNSTTSTSTVPAALVGHEVTLQTLASRYVCVYNV